MEAKSKQRRDENIYRAEKEMKCPHGRELSPGEVRLVTPQACREIPAGIPTPMKIPSSTADPSPVRPALLPPPAKIQPREMSATRMYKG